MIKIGMTRKEAQARLGIRELKAKEIEELKALANDIYTRVLGPDWRNFPAKGAKSSDSTSTSDAPTTGDNIADER
jgi:hypothetical protein